MFSRPPLVPIEPFIKLAEIAKLDKEPAIQNALQTIAITNDPQLAEDVAQILQPIAMQELLNGKPFGHPPSAEINQTYQELCVFLGLVPDAEYPLCPPIRQFNQHCYVGGASGTGKTNLLQGVALQIMPNCPVWIFDREKQDYRHLLRLVPSLIVFDAQTDFVCNPLEVHTPVKPKDHLAAFVAIFTKTHGLLGGAEAMLIKVLNGLYGRHGVFDGSDKFPTLFDLLDDIKDLRLHPVSRQAGYRDSIVNRLEAELATNPDMYQYVKGFPLEELAANSFVLEIKGLSEKQGRFLVTMQLFSLFQWRIARHERGNDLRNLVVIDEGKWIAPPGFNENIGFTPLDYVLAQSRETGLGVVIADQTANLAESVFVQSRLKICFRLGSGADIDRVRKTFALTKEQADYIPKLDVGEAIVRIPKLDPFLIKVPRVRLG